MLQVLWDTRLEQTPVTVKHRDSLGQFLGLAVKLGSMTDSMAIKGRAERRQCFPELEFEERPISIGL